MPTLSWWWITVPFALALLWFELIEQRLGLDKKKAFDEMEAHKKKRIKDALEAGKRWPRGGGGNRAGRSVRTVFRR